MDAIPYEIGAYYIFDRAYDDFKRLYHIHQIGAYFVIRAKDNIRYVITKWKRRMPKNVRSDVRIRLQLKIKKFWGTTENAVKIQVYVAMTAYCLVAIIQQELKIGISTYEMLQKLSVTLTEKIQLRELFAKPKISNVKDQFEPNWQLLIIF